MYWCLSSLPLGQINKITSYFAANKRRDAPYIRLKDATKWKIFDNGQKVANKKHEFKDVHTNKNKVDIN